MTITTGRQGHGYHTGDTVEITTLDMRWWKRLLHFVTFRRPPVKVERFKITATSETTMTVPNALAKGPASAGPA